MDKELAMELRLVEGYIGIMLDTSPLSEDATKGWVALNHRLGIVQEPVHVGGNAVVPGDVVRRKLWPGLSLPQMSIHVDIICVWLLLLHNCSLPLADDFSFTIFIPRLMTSVEHIRELRVRVVVGVVRRAVALRQGGQSQETARQESRASPHSCCPT